MLSDIGNVRDRVVYDVEDPDLAIDPTPGAGPALVFDSRFESGNLRRAVQVHETLYDLVLSPDINSEGHTQWFFFSVTGMVPDVRYRFNIVNLEKSNSQFNFGMQPVMLSEAEAAQGALHLDVISGPNPVAFCAPPQQSERAVCPLVLYCALIDTSFSPWPAHMPKYRLQGGPGAGLAHGSATTRTT